ncbi:hypothetical protein EYC84_011616 [Monilinia fructicola]|uniref:Uncharacterized protein n=1 Tax=Monilinia fructicola TaxID=38448 RepID=A0A5M9J6I8_MONFR|nr:hypothetical protein EYC84_011616 [Monilinia fructicola]
MFAEPESPDAETIQFYKFSSGGGGRGGKLVLGDGLAPFGGRKSNSSTDEAHHLTMYRLQMQEEGEVVLSGGRSEGTGSDGAVSAMSTPSQPTSNGNGNISEMTNWHANPSILLPGQPTPIQSQYQYQPYHRRGNSQSNNGSAGSFSSLPQQTYAQTQYLKQQAQIQYHNQVAQSRRMHANVAQNPHQMYTESKEHQQNMGYQNALLLAQELEHERVQAQAQARVTLPYTNSEVTHEQNTGISHQETTYQSAPIELGINARSQAQHSQIPRSPLAPVPSTSTAISQTQLRALHSPQQREQQQHEENTRMQVQANLYGGSQMLSNTYSEVPAVVAPTPPPTMQNPQNPQTETQTQTQNTNLVTKDAPQHPRTQDHILSWAEYDGGRETWDLVRG